MQEIPLHQIDNFILLLKWAHQKGFAVAEEHIMQPLQMYFGTRDTEPRGDLAKSLEAQRKMREWRIASNIYKHLFHAHAFEADHHPLVSTLNAFLLDLQGEAALRKTTFAYEFFKAYEWPLKNLQSIVSQEVMTGIEKVFDAHEDVHVVVSHSLTTNQRQALNAEARELYNRIELAYARGDEAQLSYLLAQFTGRFCNFPEVAFRAEVDEIIDKIVADNAAFRHDMRSRLAVRLFQAIARAVEKTDIKTAVRGITTYVITFQDDLSLPYRSELDAIEEKMYRFIERHNLWHRVKLNTGGAAKTTAPQQKGQP
ncbi:hypothetical protein [Turneriella parva]|uniref:Uncharacterized protein n=1 Tax=Turneriella parva (strain ATCC BAA-1111 / DSM 21527 / NCTC 11395 / H) TaxID=869212 RepID=I4B6T8_TURPD|nr:hypothetical protein [Turneriella parva]AFM12995.1 hypothetical protein Turpa_2352 [Turneriella parva DSM 21527]